MARLASTAPLTSAGLVAALVAATGCSDFFVQRQEPEPDATLRVTEEWVQDALAEVDVLWVVDDTASMEDEHAALSDAAADFVAALDAAGLAWQVGVTSTALRGESAGRLRGVPWVIPAGTPDAAAALASAAWVGTEGREPAGALGAAALALQEPLRSGANRGFRRPEAALHVVVFSDGEDQSEEILGVDPVGAFLSLLDDEAARTGRAARLSAVVGDATAGCVGDGGQAVPGDRYVDAARATGGAFASICSADWSVVLDELGAVSADYPTRFPLQAVPEAGSSRVTLDGEVVDDWSIDTTALELVFEEAPPPDSVIRMTYVAAQAHVDSGVGL